MRYRAGDVPNELDRDLTHACFACGSAADAMWHGAEKTVEVCAACALRVLPKLIVDALPVSADREMGSYSAHLVGVQAAYWRGVAARLAHEKQLSRPNPDGMSRDGAARDPDAAES